jgi:hypothetical protein
MMIPTSRRIFESLGQQPSRIEKAIRHLKSKNYARQVESRSSRTRPLHNHSSRTSKVTFRVNNSNLSNKRRSEWLNLKKMTKIISQISSHQGKANISNKKTTKIKNPFKMKLQNKTHNLRISKQLIFGNNNKITLSNSNKWPINRKMHQNRLGSQETRRNQSINQRKLIIKKYHHFQMKFKKKMNKKWIKE